MSKSKKQSTKGFLLTFLTLSVLICIGILVNTFFDLTAFGQILLYIVFLASIFTLDQFFNKKLSGQLFSMPLMSLLVLLFFIAVAFATFVETIYDTTTALKVIYRAPWFEWIIFILFINLAANIKRYSLFKKEKIGSFIFHLSFLIIVIGAFVTREFGFEGMMSIPEGKASNYFLSAETYLQLKVDDKAQQYNPDLQMLVSEHTNNDFKHTFNFPGKDNEIYVSYVDFLPKYFEEDTLHIVENGQEYFDIVTSGMKSNYVKSGDTFNTGQLKLAFNSSQSTDAIHIITTDSGLYFTSPFDIEYLQMPDIEKGIEQSKGVLVRDSLHQFHVKRLYMAQNDQFVFKNYIPNGEYKTVSHTHHPKGVDNMVVKITDGTASKTVKLPGGKGIFPTQKSFTLNGLNYRLSFGSKIKKLPFSILLRDFQLDKYIGTNSPSSYASEVTVIDGKKNFDHRIFMNNVLDYKGYRFFQSSYGQSAEGENTVLSVNHDFIGTWITYIGYIIMALGFFLSLFTNGSRFKFLLKKANETRLKREKLNTILLLIGLSSSLFTYAQDSTQIQTSIVNLTHADSFSRLAIQDLAGRYVPVHTVADKLLRKISRQETFEGQTPTQVFIGLHTDFKYWTNANLVYITGDSTARLLGVKDTKRAKYNDFFNEDGSYKLATNMKLALTKDPSRRNVFEKNVIKTDERLNILRGVLFGAYLKIFPMKSDSTDKWYSPSLYNNELHGEDSAFVQGIMSWYFQAVNSARTSGDWQAANKVASMMKIYQQKTASKEAMPSAQKIEWEITYNKVKAFKHLKNLYLLFGLLILIFQFIQIFKPKSSFKWPLRIGVIIFIGLFIVHGLALGLRWYLSGHAPWSNGYEAIIFIGFVTILAGLLFTRQSKIVLGATGILAWLMLFVAGLNNMDPQISQLEPVLKSYWLMIHVAIITGSYAFLGLPAILAVINFFIDIFKTEHNIKRLRLTAKELRYITEMSMTIGLFMLTIGTFLGGVWANESWGRYWGWDPKETWALAAVLVYTIILHFRFIPGLKSDFTFNFWAFWGYSSILMTFFGVNYYLAGMHSYATGEPVPFPTWATITIIVFGIISVLAWINKNRFEKKTK